jgi:hypothetical protein
MLGADLAHWPKVIYFGDYQSMQSSTCRAKAGPTRVQGTDGDSTECQEIQDGAKRVMSCLVGHGAGATQAEICGVRH